MASQKKKELTFLMVAILMVILLLGIVTESVWFLLPRFSAVLGRDAEEVPVIIFRIEQYENLDL